MDVGEITSLEHPLLKVSYEQLAKTFQTGQKMFESEMKGVLAKLGQIDPTNKMEAFTTLTKLQGQLVKLRAALAENLEAQAVLCKDSHTKSAYLLEATKDGARYRRERLDRILVDFFLREGFYETAKKLADSSGITYLVPFDVFATARAVEERLRMHDCTAALKWCKENSHRLAKLKSTFEFKVRLQEFVELVRRGQRSEAVAYSQKHFAAFADRHLADIRTAMALLVFPVDAVLAKYKPLLAADRWEALVQVFRNNVFRLYSLTAQSLFTITTQAGLSLLKTAACTQPDQHSIDCPACSEHLAPLAACVKATRRNNSVIVCRHLGTVMDDENPPMMLPNGHVYSRKAIAQLTQGEDVLCPLTGKLFPLSSVKRLFVA
eukprot:m.10920 g.10920  ORF g.10920 m.10920 type:complete len:378 (-) comp5697_c0_seq1:106-1239(-)